ncbi:MAG TPA: phage tail sheath C-terminal domain-containing protein, partial [Gemmatimonadaceae bacterium]|nr:phage tail sheath C-terminal domain-containing protein [Gemmatimonadaceae bacterium]
ISASNPGSWFQGVTLAIDLNTRKIGGLRRPDEFNVTMIYAEVDPTTGAATTTVEVFANVSYLATSANYIATVLKADSSFINIMNGVPQAQPIPGVYAMTGPVWAPNTSFVLGSAIYDVNGNEQVVTAAGNSGRSKPAWSTAVGGVTSDGSVQWTNQGSVRLAPWSPNTAFALNQVIFDGANLEQVTAVAAGLQPKSGASGPPAWGAAVGDSSSADGTLTWTNLGPVTLGIWLPNTAYVVGAQIIDPDGDVQVATAAGTSGGTAPATWQAFGDMTADNTVTWTNRGPMSPAPWQPNTFYPNSAQVYDSNGNLQNVANATDVGISGSTQPDWPTAAATTTPDGPTLVWTLQDVSGLSDGLPLTRNDISDQSLESSKSGIYALEDAEIFTMMVLPPYGPLENSDTIDLDTTYSTIWSDALAFCTLHRAILLVDPPSPAVWNNDVTAYADVSGATPSIDPARSANSVLYYPWIYGADPLINNRQRAFAPSATVAGVISRIDGTRGVWKSPAGEEATLLGVSQLQILLNDAVNGDFNPLAVNCLRTFPIISSVVWGARTLDGADVQASQWKYLAVRRLALFIETSLYRGTQWAVFEPNDEPLWSELRLNVTSFMDSLFRRHAFQGMTAQQAYFVRCDSDTTTQTDIDNGIVNVLVGFAPLKPAEFIVITISQITGSTNS